MKRLRLRSVLFCVALLLCTGLAVKLHYNSAFNQALLQAATDHDAAREKELLRAGADPNVRVPIVDKRRLISRLVDALPWVHRPALKSDSALLVSLNGRAPGLDHLSYVLPDNVELCRSYLDAGADPNAMNADGDTPLIIAVYMQMPATAALLIDRGAAVNSANSQGYTALMVAATAGDVDMVKLLLAHGARTKSAQWTGHPIIGVVLERENASEDDTKVRFHEIAQMLRAKSGDLTAPIAAGLHQ